MPEASENQTEYPVVADAAGRESITATFVLLEAAIMLQEGVTLRDPPVAGPDLRITD